MTHILAVFVGLVMPIGAALQSHRSRGPGEPTALTTPAKITFYWSNGAMTLALAGAAIAAWLLEAGTLAQLRLAYPSNLAIGTSLALLFLGLFAADSWSEISTPQRRAETAARWRRDTAFMPANARELRHSLAMVTGAAIGEEVLYRGFLIVYLVRWLGDSPSALVAAVVVPSLVFALAHWYQRAKAVLKIALLSILFGAITVVTGSILIPALLHFIVDLVGSLLGPGLLGNDEESTAESPGEDLS